MKSVIFTFDYELFLGTDGKSSGSVEACILDPTKKIIELFDRYDVNNSIFFVDTMFLYRLLGSEDDSRNLEAFKKIENQLKTLIAKGHYVYPHIHAHWLDAKYIKYLNQWDLTENAKYRFHSLTDSEKADVFHFSIEFIRGLYNPDVSDEALGYRAGGWCIQPFDDFKEYFKDYRLKYDFSVMPGAKSQSHPWNYDFSSTPQYIYRFTDNLTNQEPRGEFIELPISMLNHGYLGNSLIRLYGLLESKVVSLFVEQEQRISLTPSLQKRATLQRIVEKMRNNKSPIPLSLERLNLVYVVLLLLKMRKQSYVQFISHPKLITDWHIKLLGFVLWLNRRVTWNYNFKNIIT